jgi:hypothetical protein
MIWHGLFSERRVEGRACLEKYVYDHLNASAAGLQQPLR